MPLERGLKTGPAGDVSSRKPSLEIVYRGTTGVGAMGDGDEFAGLVGLEGGDGQDQACFRSRKVLTDWPIRSPRSSIHTRHKTLRDE